MLKNLVSFDDKLFTSLNSIIGKNKAIDFVFKITSVYLVYLVPLGLLAAWFYFREEKIKKMLLAATVAGVVAWQLITNILGHLINRPRPIESMVGAKELVFHLPSYSFPSDHMTLIACLATYFLFAGYKKAGVWSWIIALIIGFSRVVSGMHYPGDIIAGITIGVLTAWFFWTLKKPVEKYIVNPLYKVAEFLHLA
jgi:undecaprenyl-diphosphatase